MKQAVKIVSLDIYSVSKFFALLYGAFGFISSCIIPFTTDEYITLPVGFVMPVFHLNLNLHLLRPTTLISGIGASLAIVVCCTISGWITGFLGALAFNFVAIQFGGIETSIVSVAKNDKSDDENLPSVI